MREREKWLYYLEFRILIDPYRIYLFLKIYIYILYIIFNNNYLNIDISIIYIYNHYSIILIYNNLIINKYNYTLIDNIFIYINILNIYRVSQINEKKKKPSEFPYL